MAWDLLNEDCADISDWSDGDDGNGVSEVDPAGQFRFDTNASAAGNDFARRYRYLASPPNKFIIEIKTYFDALGTVANSDSFRLDYYTETWLFRAYFASDGLFIFKTGAASTEIGTNIVKYAGTAAWQTWRFHVDKSGGEAAATVEVFLDGVSQGTFDCDYETAGTDGFFDLLQFGYATDDMVAHLDLIRAVTGTGVPLFANVYDSSVVAELIERNCKFNISVHDCGETAEVIGG